MYFKVNESLKWKTRIGDSSSEVRLQDLEKRLREQLNRSIVTIIHRVSNINRVLYTLHNYLPWKHLLYSKEAVFFNIYFFAFFLHCGEMAV